ncbi:FAR1 DNA-binding domain [Geosmithia morbida]|uniref:FAR1 DNA-binding domain n=1 Tax=Geosmithia morbida TaxID=1094350 RepID=A0A9P4YQ41_9HYPO|nr:FAR1 DNA-binding domain [Geosmithia morbida]KAF4119724.1 FAR1 DNA-binding domain [Geosmithia morbida]
MPGTTPPPSLIPPPEGIFRSFDDLMASVQRVAKDQGYGIVKLRASNYRDGKPTRYDLVCDRGGVKYSSTAKKRNPSTRKIDCPFRAKAVCEVQLGNQWRFALQEARHNHEPRASNGPSTPENAPLATSIRSFTNKLDRLSHDMMNGFLRIEQRLDHMEKRMENLETRAGNYEPRFQAIEQRIQGMEGPRMDSIPMDDVESRLLASTVM